MNLLFESHKGDAPVSLLVFPEYKPQTSALPVVERVERVDIAAQARIAELELALTDARREGHMEGLAEGERRRREDLEIERTAISHLCTGFAKERKRYFAEIEGEVVKLALAIAGRVLQRESSLDPLLLKGVVHAALAKLGDVKGAVLRMPPEALEDWRYAMRHTGLEIEADESMEAGDLRLETEGGVAELGIPAQMVEVERGFFDLMARRPA